MEELESESDALAARDTRFSAIDIPVAADVDDADLQACRSTVWY